MTENFQPSGNKYFDKQFVKELIAKKKGIPQKKLTDYQFLKTKAKELHLKATTLAHYWSAEYDINKDFNNSASEDNTKNSNKLNKKTNRDEKFEKKYKPSTPQTSHNNIKQSPKKRIQNLQQTLDEQIKQHLDISKRESIFSIKNNEVKSETYDKKSNKENIKVSYELAKELSEKTPYSTSLIFCARRAYFEVPAMRIEDEMHSLSDLTTYSYSVIKERLTRVKNELNLKEFSQIYPTIENLVE